MDDYLKSALDLVQAQARVRVMTEDEIASMVTSLAATLRGIEAGSGVGIVEESSSLGLDPKKAIKENSITCLECGKSFKVITKKHLAHHGLTPAEYREKYGYKKDTPLVSKKLQRDRRKKMKDMKIWEKRKKTQE